MGVTKTLNANILTADLVLYVPKQITYALGIVCHPRPSV